MRNIYSINGLDVNLLTDLFEKVLAIEPPKCDRTCEFHYNCEHGREQVCKAAIKKMLGIVVHGRFRLSVIDEYREGRTAENFDEIAQELCVWCDKYISCQLQLDISRGNKQFADCELLKDRVDVILSHLEPKKEYVDGNSRPLNTSQDVEKWLRRLVVDANISSADARAIDSARGLLSEFLKKPSEIKERTLHNKEDLTF